MKCCNTDDGNDAGRNDHREAITQGETRIKGRSASRGAARLTLSNVDSWKVLAKLTQMRKMYQSLGTSVTSARANVWAAEQGSRIRV